MATTARNSARRAPGARRIVTAAGRLFAQNGYAGTSMAEIAEAAGVSKATMFHHFRSKRALYDALIGEAVVGFREQLLPLLDPDDEPEEGLRRFAAAHVQRLTRLRGTMRLIMREFAEGSAAHRETATGGEMARNFSLVVEALRRAQARGRVRADADPGLAAFVLLCTSWLLTQTSAVTRRHPDLAVAGDPERYAAELARLIYHGLEPRPTPASRKKP
jgi:TetR/AcrR family transcriptional regulator